MSNKTAAEASLRLQKKVYAMHLKGMKTDAIALQVGKRSAWIRTLIGRERAMLGVNDVNKDAKDTVEYEDILQAIRSKIAPEPIIVKKNTTNKGELLVIGLADWHIGSVVKDENGKHIYDVKIAKERARTLLSNILSLVSQHIVKQTDITGIVLLFAGDIVDGEGIYKGQSFNLEEVPPKQVMVAYNIIADFVDGLQRFKKPISIYCVRGNHGRAFSDASPNSNWDYMLYLIMRTFLKGANVTVSDNECLNIDIYQWKYNLRHIGIGQSETAAGRAIISGWSQQHEADVIVCGHLHHMSISENIRTLNIMLPSLKGHDDFSESLARYSDAAQMVCGCSTKRKVTFLYRVEL